MQTDKMIQAIKNDDFITFRKLLRGAKGLKTPKVELTKAIKSHILPASQKTYINALNGIDR